MGQRGALRLPKHLQPVPNTGAAETVADRTKPVIPDPPAGWREVDDSTLSALWAQVTSDLDSAGLLARVDGMTLELCLRHFVAARQAADELAEGDIVIDDPAHGGTQKKNPAGAEFRSQSALFLEYAKQLGMSFVSRARVPAKDDDDGQPNPFAAPPAR